MVLSMPSISSETLLASQAGPASDVVPQSTRDGVWYISPQGDDQECLSFKAIQGSLTTLVDQVLSWRLIFCFQRRQGTERPESHIP